MTARPESVRRQSRSSYAYGGGPGPSSPSATTSPVLGAAGEDLVATGSVSLIGTPSSASKSAKRMSVSRAAPSPGSSASKGASQTRKGSGSVKASKRSGSIPSSPELGKNEAGAMPEHDIATNGVDDEWSRMSRDQLIALIARERVERDELETRLSATTSEQTTLNERHHTLQSLHSANEIKLQEAFDAASRLESELAGHMEVTEGLKIRLRDAEKEGRDAVKRYNYQVESFDNERAQWRAAEQTLEARLMKAQDDLAALSTSHTRSPTTDSLSAASAASAAMAAGPSATLSSPGSISPALPMHSPTFSIPQSTLEELTHLNQRIAIMTMEQVNLSSATQRLQNELEELQRLNSDLQEQNENYEALLGERMLHGMRHQIDSGLGSSLANTSVDSSGRPLSLGSGGGESESRSRPTSSLDRLDEDPYEDEEDDGAELSGSEEEDAVLEGAGDGSLESGAVAVRQSIIRTAKRSAGAYEGFGSSGGGGLDLEAELDKAKKDEEDRLQQEALRKKKARAVAERRKANQSVHLGGREGDPISSDVDKLRNEVKLLRQENKGLTTYVSKILERVIGMEGFEKVLAVDKDYKASPPMAQQRSNQGTSTTASTSPRPGLLPAMSTSNIPAPPPVPRPSPLRTQSLATPSGPTTDGPPVSPSSTASNAQSVPAGQKKGRFSMDFITSALWRGSSSSAANAAPPAPAPSASGTSGVSPNPPPLPGFKPMMLSSATKPLSQEEDEEDQRTRARLQSEMKLLGFPQHGSPVLHAGIGTSPGSRPIRVVSNRSPGHRASIGSAPSNFTSPRPPSLPPKDDNAVYEADTGRVASLPDVPLSVSPSQQGGSVKLSGHRKRPSASGREAITGPPDGGLSVGLGLSYSKDSGSTWAANSPSLPDRSRTTSQTSSPSVRTSQ